MFLQCITTWWDHVLEALSTWLLPCESIHLSLPTCWTKSRVACDLRHHDAYDTSVLFCWRCAHTPLYNSIYKCEYAKYNINHPPRRSKKKFICQPYRKTSNISRTLVGDKIVDNSDVVGASPVVAAPTTSSFSTEHLASMDLARTTERRNEKHLSFEIWCDLF